LGEDFFNIFVGDPYSFKKATDSSNAPLWKKAINGKISSNHGEHLNFDESASWLQTY